MSVFAIGQNTCFFILREVVTISVVARRHVYFLEKITPDTGYLPFRVLGFLVSHTRY